MIKRKQRQINISLATGNDASLWQYESVDAALRGNIDILARLIQPALLGMHESQQIAGEAARKKADPARSQNELAA